MVSLAFQASPPAKTNALLERITRWAFRRGIEGHQRLARELLTLYRRVRQDQLTKCPRRYEYLTVPSLLGIYEARYAGRRIDAFAIATPVDRSVVTCYSAEAQITHSSHWTRLAGGDERRTSWAFALARGRITEVRHVLDREGDCVLIIDAPFGIQTPLEGKTVRHDSSSRGR